jgi:hypothetical protein
MIEVQQGSAMDFSTVTNEGTENGQDRIFFYHHMRK